LYKISKIKRPLPGRPSIFKEPLFLNDYERSIIEIPRNELPIAGVEKKYPPTTILNGIMPYFYRWLKTEFANVEKRMVMKLKKREERLEKRHFIDAYAIFFDNMPLQTKFDGIMLLINA
jgi:hypothetical protein